MPKVNLPGAYQEEPAAEGDAEGDQPGSTPPAS